MIKVNDADRFWPLSGLNRNDFLGPSDQIDRCAQVTLTPVSAASKVDCWKDQITTDDDVDTDDSERIAWVKRAPSLNEYLHTGSSMNSRNA